MTTIGRPEASKFQYSGPAITLRVQCGAAHSIQFKSTLKKIQDAKEYDRIIQAAANLKLIPSKSESFPMM